MVSTGICNIRRQSPEINRSPSNTGNRFYIRKGNIEEFIAEKDQKRLINGVIFNGRSLWSLLVLFVAHHPIY